MELFDTEYNWSLNSKRISRFVMGPFAKTAKSQRPPRIAKTTVSSIVSFAQTEYLTNFQRSLPDFYRRMPNLNLDPVGDCARMNIVSPGSILEILYGYQ
jgi:hypothetical protein